MKNLAGIFGLSVMLLAPTVALAEDDDFFALGDEEQAQPEVTLYNYATLNIGYVSNDNFQFSKYRDLADKGGFASGDLYWEATSKDKTANWTLDITNAGLHNQELNFIWRTASNLRFNVDYSEIPLHRNNTGYTPYTGGANLVLPSTWVAGVNTSDFDLSQVNHAIDNEVLRKTLSVGLDRIFSSGLRLGVTSRFEDKTGTMLQGMAIYLNASDPQAVVLPVPVDQQSTDVEARIGFDGKRLVIDARANYLKFENANNLVTWQNPYASGLGANVDYPNGIGGYAPAPDYNMKSGSLAVGYTLNERIRVTLDGMTSKTEQQEPLQQYTANTSLANVTALPVDELGDALKTNMFGAAVFTRPLDRASVDFKYHYNERENNFARYAWNYVWGDAAAQPSADYALFNRPLHYEKEKSSVDARYRLKNRTRLGLSYDYEKTNRNYASVAETEEDIYTFSVDTPRGEHFKHRMEVSVADLSGSTYEWSESYFQELAVSLINQIPADQRWTNHPLLRQYQLANQEKIGFKWATSWYPSDKWLMQGQARVRDVRFDKSELGLTKVHSFDLNVTANYTGSDTYNSWMWVGYNFDRRQQMGRDFLGGINKPANRTYAPLPEGSDPTRNYQIQQDGDSWSAGLGMSWHISDKWSVKTSYTLLWATVEYNVTTYGAPDLAGTNFPVTRNRMHKLDTQLDYTLKENLLLSLEHQYFRYSDNSWQYDGVAIGDIDKLLTTGLLAPNEAINMIMLSMSYKF